MNEFEQLATPLIEWLRKNHHPHTAIIIDCNHAEVLEGIHAFPYITPEDYDKNQSGETPRPVGSHD